MLGVARHQCVLQDVSHQYHVRPLRVPVELSLLGVRVYQHIRGANSLVLLVDERVRN